MYSKVFVLCMLATAAMASSLARLYGQPQLQLIKPQIQLGYGQVGLQQQLLVSKPQVQLRKLAPAPLLKKVGYGPQIVEQPEPYESSIDITDEYGNVQTRQESGDAYGNKQGSYTIQGIDGISRKVNWVANDNGVQMWIQTNEPGTSSADPADVDIEANPIVIESKPRKLIRVLKAPQPYGLY